MTQKTNIAIFASGNGSNAQAIVEQTQNGTIDARVVLVVCDNADALVIERAKNLGVPCRVFNRNEFASKVDFERNVLSVLNDFEVEFLVLAGFMRLIGKTLLQKFPKKIVNIHPSLLPKYKGLDAIKQALDNHETTLGVSIHYVDEGMDTGEVIAQKSIYINENNQLQDVEKQIHSLEHKLYIETLAMLFQPQNKKP